MTFIVTLIALLIERFFDWSHVRQWSWYNTYQASVVRRVPGLSPYADLVLIIVPILIAVALVEYLLGGVLYGFLRLLFQLLILLYCLGPQNLWADGYSCINALSQGDAQAAENKLKTTFGVPDKSYAQSLHRHFLNNIFIEANRRVFAVLFWYVILGPVGAVLYRLLALSASGMSKNDGTSFLAQAARYLESILDWVPVRILTMIFALGGHFVQVFHCMRKKLLIGLSGNEIILSECGSAALGNDETGKVAEDGSAEKSAIGLLDRSFVIVLVLVAILAFLR